MNWTKIPAGKLTLAEQQLRESLDEDADAVVEKMITDPIYMRQITDFAITLTQQGAIVLTQKELSIGNPQWLRAREIMGGNFFGIEEASKYFRVKPTCQQLADLSEIPFSVTILEQCKDTHLLIAILPLSLLDIYKKFEMSRGGMFDGRTDWSRYYEEKFMEERAKISWQLICKNPVSNSASKAWEAQSVLIGEDNKVPSAREMAYAIISRYLSTKEILFKYVFVNTSSMDSRGFHVGIGHWTTNYGLNLSCNDSERCYSYLCISSAVINKTK